MLNNASFKPSETTFNTNKNQNHGISLENWNLHLTLLDGIAMISQTAPPTKKETPPTPNKLCTQQNKKPNPFLEAYLDHIRDPA
jgi:hypothetical protein